jgi:hypothetical protein
VLRIPATLPGPRWLTLAAVAALLAVFALWVRVIQHGDDAQAATPSYVSPGGVPMANGTGCFATRRGGFAGLGGGDSFIHRRAASCILGLQGASGVGVLRQDFDWATIERSPGHYNFSAYDWWVAAVASKRIRILAVLFGGSPFYAPKSGASTNAPTDRAAYGRYAAAVVARYGRNGSFWREHPAVPYLPIRDWQVWNEPNLHQYWLPRPSPKGYTKLLKAGYKAIKAVDRRANVVTAGIPDSRLHDAIRFKSFVRKMYRAGAKKYFDTLAYNAYAPRARGVISLVRQARRLMNKYRDRRGKLWLTEVGWGTSGPRHRYNIGFGRQAREIKKLLRGLYKVRKRYRVRGLIYFGWQDRPAYPPAFKDMWGLHTGLFTREGVAKRGYKSFASVAPRLR